MKTLLKNTQCFKLVMTLCLVVITLFAGVFSACEDNNNENLQHIKTKLGGCDKQYDLKSDMSEMESDTVIVTIKKNSINIFVNLPYSCKLAPFETQVEIIDSVLYMYLIDKCWVYSGVGDDCYQRCMCNYTFDFTFRYHGELYQAYKILLIDPEQEEPIIVSEDVLNLKKR